MPSTEEFTEHDTLNPKMDILWVMDNSVSMKQEIQNVVANINSFISIYIDKGYDFRMGVIPTSAWSIEAYHELQETGINPTRFPDLDFLLHPSDGLDTFSRLHTGECTNTNPGFKVIHTETPNIQENFEKNLNVFGRLDNDSATHCGFNHNGGNPPDTTHSRYVSFTHDYYYGQRSKDNDGNIIHWSNSDRGRMSNFIADERPLQSMRAFLNLSPDAELLIREDAFLAVILVTDEMDGSSYSLNPCNKAGDGVCTGDQPQHIDEDGNRIFHEVSVYTDFLDSYKGSTDLYNMYAIAKARTCKQKGTIRHCCS